MGATGSPCRFCRELLPQKSLRCRHCGMPAGWGLLVSVVAFIMTLATPVVAAWQGGIDQVFRPRDAHIDFSIQGAPWLSIEVLASNKGRSAGSIGQGVLRVTDGGRTAETIIQPEDVAFGESLLIPENSQRLVRFIPTGGHDGWMIAPNSGTCAITFTYTDSAGNGHDAREPISCARVSPFTLFWHPRALRQQPQRLASRAGGDEARP